MEHKLWEYFSAHIAAVLDSGKWVRLHFGHLTRDIVQFDIETGHPLLAWIGTTHDGAGMIIDVRTIYAYEEIDPDDGSAA